jgi:hypothetical protein
LAPPAGLTTSRPTVSAADGAVVLVRTANDVITPSLGMV